MPGKHVLGYSKNNINVYIWIHISGFQKFLLYRWVIYGLYLYYNLQWDSLNFMVDCNLMVIAHTG